MIDCLEAVDVEITNLKSSGFIIDDKKYDGFKNICNDITLLSGVSFESIVVHLNSDSINIKIGTYYVEIEEDNNDIYNVLSKAKEFKLWIAGKGTPEAMLVIDIDFDGFWYREDDLS